MTVAASLLLAVLAGCSSKTSQKTAEEPKGAEGPSVVIPPQVEVRRVPPPPVLTPSGTAAPQPQKIQQKSAKQEAGSPMDRFAKCLSDKEAVMYGVFWCDHCREQKEKFGESFKYVKYVECVNQDAPRTLIPECKAQGIKHTPTWIFADGEHVEGVMGLDQLAMKTHCKLP